jgi:hypothetical protein
VGAGQRYAGTQTLSQSDAVKGSRGCHPCRVLIRHGHAWSMDDKSLIAVTQAACDSHALGDCFGQHVQAGQHGVSSKDRT